MIPMYKGSGKRARILTCVLAALLALAFCIFSLTGKMRFMPPPTALLISNGWISASRPPR